MEDSELSDQEAAKTKQNQWDKILQDSEASQTKGKTGSDRTQESDDESDDHVHKDSLQVYQGANQEDNGPRENVVFSFDIIVKRLLSR